VAVEATAGAEATAGIVSGSDAASRLEVEELPGDEETG
jgi:hypothetical protein